MDALVETLAHRLTARNWMLVTAESCTGGMIAKRCTDRPGSSAWFFGGFVTYANAAKMRWLGVGAETLRLHGAVSEQTVREMAAGALRHSEAQVAVAVSGIAGPSGGTADKPVGTVWIGWATLAGVTEAQRFHFDGDRAAIREKAARAALVGVVHLIEKS